MHCTQVHCTQVYCTQVHAYCENGNSSPQAEWGWHALDFACIGFFTAAADQTATKHISFLSSFAALLQHPPAQPCSTVGSPPCRKSFTNCRSCLPPPPPSFTSVDISQHTHVRTKDVKRHQKMISHWRMVAITNITSFTITIASNTCFGADFV